MAKANTQVSVTIAAVDALTAPVRRMNQAVGGMLQPIAALQAAADQTQEERVAIGQRAQQVATEKFSREQLVHQFLETVLKAENILQGSP